MRFEGLGHRDPATHLDQWCRPAIAAIADLLTPSRRRATERAR
ncbi:hypothetical protein SAMN04489832_1508 [Micromonospora cremea]|uniref:Uncharacterized protein n=1 Tax=Micromonospora cremea TaxID=709881 RepID=A0A1N5VB37_9ACTN|nr:hypothetical protein SAMN04489832_1508 [Micromonospora cremea]